MIKTFELVLRQPLNFPLFALWGKQRLFTLQHTHKHVSVKRALKKKKKRRKKKDFPPIKLIFNLYRSKNMLKDAIDQNTWLSAFIFSEVVVGLFDPEASLPTRCRLGPT